MKYLTVSTLVPVVDDKQYVDKNSNVKRTTKPLCPDSFAKVMKDIDTFIFDADGVLWLGESVMPGSPKLIDYLIKNNKQIIVLTNNATKSRAVYAKKLAKLGYNGKVMNKDNLVNPAAVVADTIKRSGINGKVYLIGEQGLRDEMDELGIEYFGHGKAKKEEKEKEEGEGAFIYDIKLEENVGCVVVGYEKHFDYLKMMKAANYLKDDDVMFIATNEDETCPGPIADVIIPDAGPIVAAIKCASGREPITVGKPCTPAFKYIQRKWNINPSRTMMIGDRTNTDVKFGRDHGLKTLLVLSGCHQIEDIVENQMNDRDDMVPDYVAPCLGFLAPKHF